MSFLAFIPLLGQVLDKVLPDPQAATEAKLKLAELAQQGQLAELNATTSLALAQLEVNKAEAASNDWFRAGWRPCIGYVLAFALAYQYTLSPILIWGCAIWAPDVTPPNINVDDHLWELMFGMLGLAGWRTMDKRAGK